MKPTPARKPSARYQERIARCVYSPTLRRAWLRDGPEAAICVQDIDVQCVLQFTLIHAASCALHRRTSRVIHRSKLFSTFFSKSLSSLPRGGDENLAFFSPENNKNFAKVLQMSPKTRSAGRRPVPRERDWSLFEPREPHKSTTRALTQPYDWAKVPKHSAHGAAAQRHRAGHIGRLRRPTRVCAAL